MSEENTPAQNNTEVEVKDDSSDTQGTDNVEGKTPESEQGTETTEEDKGSDDKSDDKTDDKSEDTKSEGAPESYEDFTLPEGIEINPELTNKLTAYAKENNLSQENTQKLVDLAVENMQINEEAKQKRMIDIRDGWLKELKSDSDYGGDKFEATKDMAKRTLRDFGDETVVELLEDSGFGDHAGIIKMFAKIDKAISEDKAVDGKPSNTGTKTYGEVLYGQNN